MKKLLNEIAYYLLLPFAGIAYLIVDTWRGIKKRNHRLQSDKTGRITKYNPYTDKW